MDKPKAVLTHIFSSHLRGNQPDVRGLRSMESAKFVALFFFIPALLGFAYGKFYLAYGLFQQSVIDP